MLENWWGYFETELASGLVVTLQILIVASATTSVWAALVAALRMSGNPVLRFIAQTYIEVFRGTPLIVQLLVAFAFLPMVGITFPPFETSVLVLTLNAGGYLAEFYRSGLQAVPRIEIEAAQALGMSRSQVITRVVAPHAIRIVLPAIGTLTVVMLLATPFVYLTGLKDIMAAAGAIYGRTVDFSVYFEVTIIYVVIGLLLTALTLYLERRLKLP